MALITYIHKSAVLEKSAEVRFIIPDNIKCNQMRVLYLLHGLSEDSTSWQRYTSLERYIRHNTDTMVVMPDAGRSFYTDMAYGGAYYTYITQELPQIIASMFKVSQKREDTYIAGLSMGGYGAFKIALRNPEKYYAAASFSGVLDIASHLKAADVLPKEAFAIIGEKKDIDNSEENLMHLLKKEFKIKPKLLQMCGTEDFLYQDNINFKKEVEKYDFCYEYREGPGAHTWDFWDECLKYALEFFNINGK